MAKDLSKFRLIIGPKLEFSKEKSAQIAQFRPFSNKIVNKKWLCKSFFFIFGHNSRKQEKQLDNL
jgi:hypothetical protein